MSWEDMREQNSDDSNEESCPLTLSDWVMFLNREISNAKLSDLELQVLHQLRFWVA